MVAPVRLPARNHSLTLLQRRYFMKMGGKQRQALGLRNQVLSHGPSDPKAVICDRTTAY